ncbi:CXXC motif containing zinc binding protein-like [Glandiceps talaboti]
MVKIGLQIKANLENVTNLRPEGEDFRWYLKLKCLNCGEEPDHFQYLTLLESAPLKGGRGSASLVAKCRLCSRENSIDIIKETIGSYNADDNLRFKTMVTFDCRGMEPTDFSPRTGFSCQGANSNAFFEVDLKEKEWVDYDEKAKESIGIYEVESKFIKV